VCFRPDMLSKDWPAQQNVCFKPNMLSKDWPAQQNVHTLLASAEMRTGRDMHWRSLYFTSTLERARR